MPASIKQADAADFKALGSVRNNAVLNNDDWTAFDNQVVTVSRQVLTLMSDFVSSGMTYSLPNAYSYTQLEHNTVGDSGKAKLSMDSDDENDSDRIEFKPGSTPLPIISSGFQINNRVLAVARRAGTPLETIQAANSTRRVGEKIEDLIMNGAGKMQFAGSKIQGLSNATGSGTYTIQDWANPGVTGEQIVADVLAMKQVNKTNLCFGGSILYVSSTFEARLGEDYKGSSDKTLQTRLEEIPDIMVKVINSVAANTVLLVVMNSSTADLIVGYQPTLAEWRSTNSENAAHNFKVSAIVVPRMRLNSLDKTGVVRGTI